VIVSLLGIWIAAAAFLAIVIVAVGWDLCR